jgi:thymidylate synthase
VTGLKRGEFVHVMGDAHVYSNHVEPLKEQLERAPREFPTLTISDRVKNLEDCTMADLEISGYAPHGKIKMEMAV